MSELNYEQMFKEAVAHSQQQAVIPMRDELRLIAKKIITDEDIDDPVILNLAQEILKLYAKILIKSYQDENDYQVATHKAGQAALDQLWKPVTITNLYNMLNTIDTNEMRRGILAQRQLPSDFQRKNILATVDQIKTLHGNDLNLEPIRIQTLSILKPVIDKYAADDVEVDFKQLIEQSVQEAGEYIPAKQRYCHDNKINNNMILNYNAEELAAYHQGILNEIHGQLDK